MKDQLEPPTITDRQLSLLQFVKLSQPGSCGAWFHKDAQSLVDLGMITNDTSPKVTKQGLMVLERHFQQSENS